MKTSISRRTPAIVDRSTAPHKGAQSASTTPDAAVLSGEFKGVLIDAGGRIAWRCAHLHHKREVAVQCAAGERKAAVAARREAEKLAEERKAAQYAKA